MTTAIDHPLYNYKVVRQFAIMTVVWGIVGMLVGVLIAAQLAWPRSIFDLPWTHFGRLRPLHTNAVIFAFGGCALLATSFYIVQRTCQARLFSDGLASFVFWGWQLVIVSAAITLPLGMTTSQGIRRAGVADRHPDHHGLGLLRGGLFGTIDEAQDLAHLCGQLVSGRLHHRGGGAAHGQQRGDSGHMTKSYSVYAGTIDAMVQWWYGHNAVGFFLTAGFLGMMYYFVPKQAERPVYSYRCRSCTSGR
jgi:cytochrome c oxidase cbb3-type subunit 1